MNKTAQQALKESSKEQSLKKSDLYKLSKDELILVMSKLQDMKDKEANAKIEDMFRQIKKHGLYITNCECCDAINISIAVPLEEGDKNDKNNKNIEFANPEETKKIKCLFHNKYAKYSDFTSCSECNKHYCKDHAHIIKRTCRYCNCGKPVSPFCDECWETLENDENELEEDEE